MGRSQGRFTQATRCFRVLDRLRGYREGVPINELADEFEVGRDTIQDDIDALELGGYRIDYEHKAVEGPSGKSPQALAIAASMQNQVEEMIRGHIRRDQEVLDPR